MLPPHETKWCPILKREPIGLPPLKRCPQKATARILHAGSAYQGTDELEKPVDATEVLVPEQGVRFSA
jgi:hypothetical protein